MAALDDLADIIRKGIPEGVDRNRLAERSETALEGLFGERYQQRSAHAIRTVLMPSEENVSFAGLVHRDSPNSGAYGGMSLIWFPVPGGDDRYSSSLLTFVCGTRGLSPDEHILGRPGHSRHLHALSRYLASSDQVFAWVKHDPTNLGEPMPQMLKGQYLHYAPVFARYGNYIYCAIEVPQDEKRAKHIVSAFLDFYAWERGWQPLRGAADQVGELKSGLRAHLFPRVDRRQVIKLLRERRFVILEGPPGTGKTRLAREVLEIDFRGAGMSVQFHPAITYETFVAGISPQVQASNLLFRLAPGWLVDGIRHARRGPFMLHIDEINRADLGRVLGEAIYLLEPREIAAGQPRRITLPQPLEDQTQEIEMPMNLYLLGTMNSADRSIAILDMAVRRRFAFVQIWPDIEVVDRQGLSLATDAFAALQDIFAQYAPDDALVLMPGHSYFLAADEAELINRLRYELLPLLTEYLQEGRLGSCESDIRTYMGWLESKIVEYDAKTTSG